MADYIALTCPSCGAKLEVTEDIGQFACAHCGQEHILYQAGGIIALKPLVEGMKNIEAAVDDASLDLAINRLYFEIDELDDRKKNILEEHARPSMSDTFKLTILSWSILFCFFPVIFTRIPASIQNLHWGISIFLLIGILIAIIFQIIYGNSIREWQLTTGAEIKELDKRIEQKRLEMKQLKDSNDE